MAARLSLKVLLLPILALFFLMPSCEAGQDGSRMLRSAATSVDFQLPSNYPFRSIGYYVALEKGFYNEVGLDVRLREGGGGISPLEEVLSGRVQFAEGNSEVLLAHLRGRPLVALAAILQHSPAVFLVRSDSSIRTPRDLVGKKIMSAGRTLRPEFQAMLLREGIAPESINLRPSNFDIADLANGSVDAYEGHLGDEPFQLMKAGVDFFIINPSHYGVDYYDGILFASESEVLENPERVDAFRLASLRGWRYALDHPGESIDLLASKYRLGKSKEAIEYEIRVLRSLVLPELVEIGHMNPERWRSMADTFKLAGLVDQSVVIGEVFLHDSGAASSKSQLLRIVLSFSIALVLILAIVLLMFVIQRRLRREIRLRRDVEEKLRNANGLLERVGRLAKVGGWELDLVGDRSFWTDEALRIRGLAPGTILSREDSLAVFSSGDDQAWNSLYEAAIRDGTSWEHESALITTSGEKVWVHSVGEAVFRDGRAVKLIGAIQDVTERKAAETDLLNRSREFEMHNRILRQINRGMPLDETLESMAWQIETLHPEVRSAIMLVDESGKYLHCGTAPSLPDSFIDAINGMRIREGEACCGTAASRCELVVVSDLEHHPYFDEYRDVIRMAGVSACWSQPILDYSGCVLGTFAFYYRVNIEPGADETILIETYAGLAGLVIERHRAEKQIRNLAFYDTLTQLPNRRMLDDRLNLAMALSKRTGRHGAVMFVDLDNFKPLNDAHGHSVGDLLLIQVAQRLVGCVRETDTVARFGGDEFVVMLSELDTGAQESEQLAGRIAEKIRAALAEPYVMETKFGGVDGLVEHHCTASIGIVLFVNHIMPLEEIMRRADAAMYLAKDAGRNTVYFMPTVNSA